MNTNENINEDNLYINLNFIIVFGNNQNMSFPCILSSKEEKKIKCSISKELDEYFILETKLYSDDNKIVSIYQNNIEMKYIWNVLF